MVLLVAVLSGPARAATFETDDGFAITLSFSDVPQRLTIPFDALVAFADPSVRFGLQFDVGEDDKPAWKVSVNDLVIKALAMALQRVPDANVTWTAAEPMSVRGQSELVVTYVPARAA